MASGVSSIRIIGSGIEGRSENHFAQPRGISIDLRTKELFVCDCNNHRIQVFSLISLAFTRQIGRGTQGSLPGCLNFAVGMCLDYENHQIFVADTNNHRVVIFDQESGSHVRNIGSHGEGLGQLSSPYGVCIDRATSLLYVADYDNHRVQVFHKDTGEFQRIIGFGFGSAPGQMNQPIVLCIDDETGYLFVADYSNNRVQIFNKDTGVYIRQIGGDITGLGSDALTGPRGLCIDGASGLLFISDRENHRIKIYNKNTFVFIRHLGFGQGSAPGQFNRPMEMCINNEEGSLFVVDGYNHRVQIIMIPELQGVAKSRTATSAAKETKPKGYTKASRAAALVDISQALAIIENTIEGEDSENTQEFIHTTRSQSSSRIHPGTRIHLRFPTLGAAYDLRISVAEFENLAKLLYNARGGSALKVVSRQKARDGSQQRCHGAVDAVVNEEAQVSSQHQKRQARLRKQAMAFMDLIISDEEDDDENIVADIVDPVKLSSTTKDIKSTITETIYSKDLVIPAVFGLRSLLDRNWQPDFISTAVIKRLVGVLFDLSAATTSDVERFRAVEAVTSLLMAAASIGPDTSQQVLASTIAASRAVADSAATATTQLGEQSEYSTLQHRADPPSVSSTTSNQRDIVVNPAKCGMVGTREQRMLSATPASVDIDAVVFLLAHILRTESVCSSSDATAVSSAFGTIFDGGSSVQSMSLMGPGSPVFGTKTFGLPSPGGSKRSNNVKNIACPLEQFGYGQYLKDVSQLCFGAAFVAASSHPTRLRNGPLGDMQFPTSTLSLSGGGPKLTSTSSSSLSAATSTGISAPGDITSFPTQWTQGWVDRTTTTSRSSPLRIKSPTKTVMSPTNAASTGMAASRGENSGGVSSPTRSSSNKGSCAVLLTREFLDLLDCVFKINRARQNKELMLEGVVPLSEAFSWMEAHRRQSGDKIGAVRQDVNAMSDGAITTADSATLEKLKQYEAIISDLQLQVFDKAVASFCKMPSYCLKANKTLTRGGRHIWQPDEPLAVGDLVDAMDKEKSWFESYVTEIRPFTGEVKVHFMGWGSKWDDWISEAEAPMRIAPLNTRTKNWRGGLFEGGLIEIKCNEDTVNQKWMWGKIIAMNVEEEWVDVSYTFTHEPTVVKRADLYGETLCPVGMHTKDKSKSAASSIVRPAMKVEELIRAKQKAAASEDATFCDLEDCLTHEEIEAAEAFAEAVDSDSDGGDELDFEGFRDAFGEAVEAQVQGRALPLRGKEERATLAGTPNKPPKVRAAGVSAKLKIFSSRTKLLAKAVTTTNGHNQKSKNKNGATAHDGPTRECDAAQGDTMRSLVSVASSPMEFVSAVIFESVMREVAYVISESIQLDHLLHPSATDSGSFGCTGGRSVLSTPSQSIPASPVLSAKSATTIQRSPTDFNKPELLASSTSFNRCSPAYNSAMSVIRTIAAGAARRLLVPYLTRMLAVKAALRAETIALSSVVNNHVMFRVDISAVPLSALLDRLQVVAGTYSKALVRVLSSADDGDGGHIPASTAKQSLVPVESLRQAAARVKSSVLLCAISPIARMILSQIPPEDTDAMDDIDVDAEQIENSPDMLRVGVGILGSDHSGIPMRSPRSFPSMHAVGKAGIGRYRKDLSRALRRDLLSNNRFSEGATAVRKLLSHLFLVASPRDLATIRQVWLRVVTDWVADQCAGIPQMLIPDHSAGSVFGSPQGMRSLLMEKSVSSPVTDQSSSLGSRPSFLLRHSLTPPPPAAVMADPSDVKELSSFDPTKELTAVESLNLLQQLMGMLHKARSVARMEFNDNVKCSFAPDLAFARAIDESATCVRRSLIRALVFAIDEVAYNGKRFHEEQRRTVHSSSPGVNRMRGNLSSPVSSSSGLRSPDVMGMEFSTFTDAAAESQVKSVSNLLDFARTILTERLATDFHRFYEMLLAKRLLGSTYASLAAEHSLIDSLPICASTMPLARGMLREIESTSRTMMHFRRYLVSRIDAEEITFSPWHALAVSQGCLNIHVLTGALWPTGSVSAVPFAALRLPTVLQMIAEEFELFFSRTSRSCDRSMAVHDAAGVHEEATTCGGIFTGETASDGTTNFVGDDLFVANNETPIAAGPPVAKRRLHWCHGLGSVTMVCRLDQPNRGEASRWSTLTLELSTPQTAVMMAFDGHLPGATTLSVRAISECTGLFGDELVAVLNSLKNASLLELSDQDGGYKLSRDLLSGALGRDEDSFKPIRVNYDRWAEAKELAEREKGSLLSWRASRIDACIVRELKKASRESSGNFRAMNGQVMTTVLALDEIVAAVMSGLSRVHSGRQEETKRSSCPDILNVCSHEIKTRLDCLVSQGLIEVVPGASEQVSLRTVGYSYLPEDPAGTASVSQNNCVKTVQGDTTTSTNVYAMKNNVVTGENGPTSPAGDSSQGYSSMPRSTARNALTANRRHTGTDLFRFLLKKLNFPRSVQTESQHQQTSIFHEHFAHLSLTDHILKMGVQEAPKKTLGISVSDFIESFTKWISSVDVRVPVCAVHTISSQFAQSQRIGSALEIVTDSSTSPTAPRISSPTSIGQHTVADEQRVLQQTVVNTLASALAQLTLLRKQHSVGLGLTKTTVTSPRASRDIGTRTSVVDDELSEELDNHLLALHKVQVLIETSSAEISSSKKAQQDKKKLVKSGDVLGVFPAVFERLPLPTIQLTIDCFEEIKRRSSPTVTPRPTTLTATTTAESNHPPLSDRNHKPRLSSSSTDISVLSFKAASGLALEKSNRGSVVIDEDEENEEDELFDLRYSSPKVTNPLQKGSEGLSASYASKRDNLIAQVKPLWNQQATISPVQLFEILQLRGGLSNTIAEEASEGYDDFSGTPQELRTVFARELVSRYGDYSHTNDVQVPAQMGQSTVPTIPPVTSDKSAVHGTVGSKESDSEIDSAFSPSGDEKSAPVERVEEDAKATLPRRPSGEAVLAEPKLRQCDIGLSTSRPLINVTFGQFVQLAADVSASTAKRRKCHGIHSPGQFTSSSQQTHKSASDTAMNTLDPQVASSPLFPATSPGGRQKGSSVIMTSPKPTITANHSSTLAAALRLLGSSQSIRAAAKPSNLPSGDSLLGAPSHPASVGRGDRQRSNHRSPGATAGNYLRSQSNLLGTLSAAYGSVISDDVGPGRVSAPASVPRSSGASGGEAMRSMGLGPKPPRPFRFPALDDDEHSLSGLAHRAFGPSTGDSGDANLIMHPTSPQRIASTGSLPSASLPVASAVACSYSGMESPVLSLRRGISLPSSQNSNAVGESSKSPRRKSICEDASNGGASHYCEASDDDDEEEEEGQWSRPHAAGDSDVDSDAEGSIEPERSQFSSSLACMLLAFAEQMNQDLVIIFSVTQDQPHAKRLEQFHFRSDSAEAADADAGADDFERKSDGSPFSYRSDEHRRSPRNYSGTIANESLHINASIHSHDGLYQVLNPSNVSGLVTTLLDNCAKVAVDLEIWDEAQGELEDELLALDLADEGDDRTRRVCSARPTYLPQWQRMSFSYSGILRKSFKELDRDGDGYLTEADFRYSDVVESLGRPGRLAGITETAVSDSGSESSDSICKSLRKDILAVSQMIHAEFQGVIDSFGEKIVVNGAGNCHSEYNPSTIGHQGTGSRLPDITSKNYWDEMLRRSSGSIGLAEFVLPKDIFAICIAEGDTASVTELKNMCIREVHMLVLRVCEMLPFLTVDDALRLLYEYEWDANRLVADHSESEIQQAANATMGSIIAPQIRMVNNSGSTVPTPSISSTADDAVAATKEGSFICLASVNIKRGGIHERPKRRMSRPPERGSVCSRCGEVSKPSETFALRCRHWQCMKCWLMLIKSSLPYQVIVSSILSASEDGAAPVCTSTSSGTAWRCPHPQGCSCVMQGDFVEFLCGVEVRRLFYLSQLRTGAEVIELKLSKLMMDGKGSRLLRPQESLLEASRRSPARDRLRAEGRPSSGGNPRSEGTQGPLDRRLCGSCLRPYHAPAPCSLMDWWSTEQLSLTIASVAASVSPSRHSSSRSGHSSLRGSSSGTKDSHRHASMSPNHPSAVQLARRKMNGSYLEASDNDVARFCECVRALKAATNLTMANRWRQRADCRALLARYSSFLAHCAVVLSGLEAGLGSHGSIVLSPGSNSYTQARRIVDLENILQPVDRLVALLRNLACEEERKAAEDEPISANTSNAMSETILGLRTLCLKASHAVETFVCDLYRHTDAIPALTEMSITEESQKKKRQNVLNMAFGAVFDGPKGAKESPNSAVSCMKDPPSTSPMSSASLQGVGMTVSPSSGSAKVEETAECACSRDCISFGIQPFFVSIVRRKIARDGKVCKDAVSQLQQFTISAPISCTEVDALTKPRSPLACLRNIHNLMQDGKCNQLIALAGYDPIIATVRTHVHDGDVCLLGCLSLAKMMATVIASTVNIVGEGIVPTGRPSATEGNTPTDTSVKSAYGDEVAMKSVGSPREGTSFSSSSSVKGRAIAVLTTKGRDVVEKVLEVHMHDDAIAVLCCKIIEMILNYTAAAPSKGANSSAVGSSVNYTNTGSSQQLNIPAVKPIGAAFMVATTLAQERAAVTLELLVSTIRRRVSDSAEIDSENIDETDASQPGIRKVVRAASVCEHALVALDVIACRYADKRTSTAIAIAFTNRDVCRAIMAAGKSFRLFGDISAQFFSLIGHLTRNYTTLQTQFGDYGAIEEVVSIMRNGVHEVVKCQRSCWALGNLVYLHSRNAERLVAAGGCEVIVEVLRRSDSPSLRAQACSCISLCAVGQTGNEFKERERFDIKERFRTAGAVDVLESILQQMEGIRPVKKRRSAIFEPKTSREVVSPPLAQAVENALASIAAPMALPRVSADNWWNAGRITGV